MDRIIIAIAILLGSILIIENFAINTQALIFVSYGQAGMLSLISVGLGALLGYGIRGITDNKNTEEEDF